MAVDNLTDFESMEDDLDSAPVKASVEKQFTEVCFKCGGDGRYHHPSSLGHQICTKCKGSGRLIYKTSRLQREKAKSSAVARKEKKLVDNLAAFESEHPEFAAWWKDSTFDFAVSLREAVRKWGSLTNGQLAAGKRCIEKFNAAQAAKAAVINNAQSVNISGIESAFARGQRNAIKRPKIRLLEGDNTFVFSLAPATGRNAGSVYVVSEERYLGRITEGKFIRASSCSSELERSVIAACADPLQSAVAYGKRFGICSCCGRDLTNQESIDLGIGPICREKFF